MGELTATWMNRSTGTCSAKVPSDFDGKAEHDDHTDRQCGDADTEKDQSVAFGEHLRGDSGDEQDGREQHRGEAVVVTVLVRSASFGGEFRDPVRTLSTGVRSALT